MCMGKPLTKALFIERSEKTHGNYYDYSRVDYIPGNTKVKIICRKHGLFLQNPHNHLIGQGCPKCGIARTRNKTIKPLNRDAFILEAKEIHKDNYDYSKVDQIIYRSKKIKIICRKHGEFLQLPWIHLGGAVCRKCSRYLIGKSLLKGQTQFIKEANLMHHNKYDYSKTVYAGNSKKVIIICDKHGEFLQTPLVHLRGNGNNVGCGCPQCHHEKLLVLMRKTTEEFLKGAIKIHGLKYDYSKVTYINSEEKVIIICKKHGEFLQNPHSHLKGCGCPQCKSSKGESKIATWLENNRINFKREKTFKGCKNIRPLRFDFYLPEKNICIEYDGPHHFKRVIWSGDENLFKYSEKCDKIKDAYCKNNGINLIRIPYTDIKKIEIIMKEKLICD